MTFFGWELRRILGYAFVICVVVWVVKDPQGAAAEVHVIFQAIGHIADSFITFITASAK